VQFSRNDAPSAGPARELSADELTAPLAAAELGFATTADIAIDGDWFGQERAIAALEMGLALRNSGYNIYVCGLHGTHREQLLASLVHDLTSDSPTPHDRVLVQNFRNTDRPRALLLPTGWGRRLQEDMQDLVRELRRLLPETFRKETFEDEKERLSEKFGEQGEAINRQLGERAEAAGFSLQVGPGGEIGFVPIKDGKPMSDEELSNLTDEQREPLRRNHRELQREVKAVFRQHQKLLRQLGREVKEVERRVAEEALAPAIEELNEKYPHADVREYLSEVRQYVLEHLTDFQESQPQNAMASMMAPPTEDELFVDYRINVLVDNSENDGAPVIVETAPTYRNLFGAVERMVDRHGRLVTNFTRVTTGSLLRAHGGCLVIPVINALMEPFVWRGLKQCLKQQKLEIEGYDPFAMFATSALKPEPMDLDVRIVLVGPTEIFQMLYFHDDEFREIFKVRAEFGIEADGVDARRNCIAEIARICRSEDLPPFDAAAVAEVLRHASRWIGDRRKLPSQWTELGDLLREAAYWARRSDHAVVGAEDVRKTMAQRSFRVNRVETKIREWIREGTILIDVDGERVGQINGLAVMDIGGHAFGRPSRITATVSLGQAGIIAVDREAQMSGKTFDKAVLIITGYLRHVYAQRYPLSLSASLAFEQSYGGIEGDSASAAELFALISSLSGVPLRQDLAVTGSVNQFGEIQPIGGVTEKVEGFYYACREFGLSGRQGVVIPAQNIDNLVLDDEVMRAVSAGTFHIYPIRTIDEGLEVFTGVKAGSITEKGTIHQRAAARLYRMARQLKRFGTRKEEAATKPVAKEEVVPPSPVPAEGS